MIDKVTTFTGISLSNTKFEDVKSLVFHLERTGFYSYGKQERYINNDFKSKKAFFDEIRAINPFNDGEFGTIFLPWSGEVYIVANPRYEQFMLPIIKQYDTGAYINLRL